MADEPHNHANLELSDVPRMPGQPEAQGTSAGSEERKDFEPKAYYFGAWHLLKQDLFVFLWKLGADFLRTVVALSTLFLLGAVLTLGFAGTMDTPQGPLAGIERFIGKLATPEFVVGAVGVLFCVWLVGTMIDVLVLSGIWGTLATGARGEPIVRFRTFFANLTTRFPAVLSLRITTLAAQATVALLGLTLFVSIFEATTGTSAFANTSIWTRGLLWATPLTLLGALTALIRLTMEVAAAPLIIEGRTLGDAIFVAARLVIRRFAEVYRILIVAASLLLVPLFLYWGVLTFGNLTMDVAALAPVNALLRFGGEVILFVSSAAIALMFYGAIFLYYAHQMGMIDEIPGSKDDHSDAGSQGAGGGRRSGRVGFTKETTLEELLPDEYPNIVDLADVLREEPADGDDDSEDDLGASASSAGEQENQPDDGLSGDDIFDSDDDLDTNDRD